MMKETKEATFKRDISDGRVLVDFWAEWCGPCRVIHPVLEEIARETDDFEVLSLDIDKSPSVAAECGVQSIPTMIFFIDGKEVTRIVGAAPKKKILEELSQYR